MCDHFAREQFDERDFLPLCVLSVERVLLICQCNHRVVTCSIMFYFLYFISCMMLKVAAQNHPTAALVRTGAFAFPDNDFSIMQLFNLISYAVQYKRVPFTCHQPPFQIVL